MSNLTASNERAEYGCSYEIATPYESVRLVQERENHMINRFGLYIEFFGSKLMPLRCG